MNYERKRKEKTPVIAICYDFDKTLSPDDMQAQGYIQSVGWDVDEFWKKSNELASSSGMDQNLAYMYVMLREAEGKLLFTRETLMNYGSRVQLFPGVDDWFERIRGYGASHGVKIEHYIISSGLKEMIEGTRAARSNAFERIYASTFHYNEKGVAVWPAQVVNYTNKTQFLFRIEKGVLDINDPAVNDVFLPDELRIPRRNMIYIGDSDTDVPCMKLVREGGGYSIGVYNAQTQDKTKVYKMMRDGRIDYFAPADYSAGSELDALVKAMIDRVSVGNVLEAWRGELRQEQQRFDIGRSEADRRRVDRIIALENSHSFADTHSIVRELQKLEISSPQEREMLFGAALKNNQVRLVLGDADVRRFYTGLIEGMKNPSESSQAIEQLLAQSGEEQ